MKKVLLMALVVAALIACLSSCSLFACKHKNVEIDPAVAATCTKTGLTEGKHCAKFGEILVKQKTVPIAHNFGEWETVKAADCFYSGEKVRSCQTCSIKENVIVEPIPHDFKQDSETKLFSCTACEATIFAGNLYKVFDVEQNWYDAYKTCNEIGGHLVTITSAYEQNFLTQMIENRELEFARKYLYFTGSIKNTNVWEWITGEEFLYTNWSAGGQDSDSNDWHIALATTLNIGEWEDVEHFQKWGFICEWELDIKESEHYFTEWEIFSEADCFRAGEQYRYCTHCGVEEIESIAKIQHSFAFDEAKGVTLCEHCNAAKYDGRIYKIFEVSLSWFDAYTYCDEIGGHLATITSANEQQFIETYMNSQSYSDRPWIGAYSDGTKWNWVTEEKFEYTNWLSGQPNCDKGYEFFMNINETSIGVWNDANPYRILHLICEWEAE